MTDKPKFAVGEKVSVYLEYSNAIVKEIFSNKSPYFYKVSIDDTYETSVQEEFLDHAN